MKEKHDNEKYRIGLFDVDHWFSASMFDEKSLKDQSYVRSVLVQLKIRIFTMYNL